MWTWFYRLASPPYVYRTAVALTPWFMTVALIAIACGLIGGLGFAPPDYQQGDAFRIIYVHVPSAYMSLFCYTAMALAGAIGLIWRIKMSYALAAATAPVGASFTVLALVTGSLWGRPMWGTYWAWDPRNVPIIHYSVQWWNSLHQGATIAKIGKPSMPGSMLWPLLTMLLGFTCFYGAVVCMRLRGEVLNRERQSAWVREAIKS
jgi:heme exporter protein C